jgi:uncharacterized protein
LSGAPVRLAFLFPIAAALGGCGGPAPAAAKAPDCRGVPTLTGRVVDGADILSPAAETRLTSELAGLERRTSDQIVVATVQNRGGRTIEEMGLRFGNCWGIGQKGVDNGVVILLVTSERKLRIEVGKGLEGLLTDARAKAVIDGTMVPRLARRDYDGAVEAGVAQIDALLSSDTRRPRPRPDGKRG